MTITKTMQVEYAIITTSGRVAHLFNDETKAREYAARHPKWKLMKRTTIYEEI